MKKYLLLIMCVVLGSTITSAQTYRSIRIAERTHTTYESFSGVECRSITPQSNGSYSVEFFNSNYNDSNDITTYSFYWYLSYKGKRVSDYYQTAMRCRATEQKNAWVWPDEVPRGNERYVTVQFGKEPPERDRRDDD